MERFATRIDADVIKLQQSFNHLSAEKDDLELRLSNNIAQLERHRGALQALKEMHATLTECVTEQRRVDQMTALREEARNREEQKETS